VRHTQHDSLFEQPLRSSESGLHRMSKAFFLGFQLGMLRAAGAAVPESEKHPQAVQLGIDTATELTEAQRNYLYSFYWSTESPADSVWQLGSASLFGLLFQHARLTDAEIFMYVALHCDLEAIEATGAVPFLRVVAPGVARAVEAALPCAAVLRRSDVRAVLLAALSGRRRRLGAQMATVHAKLLAEVDNLARRPVAVRPARPVHHVARPPATPPPRRARPSPRPVVAAPAAPAVPVAAPVAADDTATRARRGDFAFDIAEFNTEQVDKLLTLPDESTGEAERQTFDMCDGSWPCTSGFEIAPRDVVNMQMDSWPILRGLKMLIGDDPYFNVRRMEPYATTSEHTDLELETALVLWASLQYNKEDDEEGTTPMEGTGTRYLLVENVRDWFVRTQVPRGSDKWRQTAARFVCALQGVDMPDFGDNVDQMEAACKVDAGIRNRIDTFLTGVAETGGILPHCMEVAVGEALRAAGPKTTIVHVLGLIMDDYARLVPDVLVGGVWDLFSLPRGDLCFYEQGTRPQSATAE
jgi:hypothetical protein